ncbi:MAG TPA: MarR family transcriptional regulator [Ktedonobacterales bacterium]|nr:MarR family transcriptional regulator [Ktedonobacterales bacterium]
MAGQSDEAERRAALNAELVVLGEVASTESALFHQAAAARYGLGITDMKALGALLQEGPMTAGQLARRLSLTTGAITSVIDRLAKRDLVTREPDPRDRRKVIVVANQARLAAGENVYLAIGQAFSRLHDTLSTEELEFLVRYHQASIELTKREIANLAARDGAEHDGHSA